MSDSPVEAGKISRRNLLLQGAATAGAAGFAAIVTPGCADIKSETSRLTGPGPATYLPLPASTTVAAAALHVANRIGFGPRPGDISRIAAMGTQGWIEEQLADSKSMEEDPAVAWRVDSLDTQQTLRDAPDALYSMSYEQLLLETQQAALLRAVYSRHQLRENLADFWTNHFNIYALKTDGQALVPVDTEMVVRSHLWSFPEMLNASANSPAMLNYLDNKLNHKGVANENYARELLELHTLGVKSGYTLRDIQEVARCFTGWTIKTGLQRGQYEFIESQHDTGSKYIPFLNLRIAPNGNRSDAVEVIRALANHPATGRFLATKLSNHFLGAAPEEIVSQSAAVFVSSGGDVRRMLRPILLDGLARQDLNRRVLKRPIDYLASALRATAADTDGGEELQKHLEAMGQPLYQWPMPDGFPEKSTAWTGSMLPRWNFALALSANAIPGTNVDISPALKAANAHTPEEHLDALSRLILASPSNQPEVQETCDQIKRHMDRAGAAGAAQPQIVAECMGLLLASPSFQWK